MPPRAHLSMLYFRPFFEVEQTIKSMPNRKVVGHDELPAELLNSPQMETAMVTAVYYYGGP